MTDLGPVLPEEAAVLTGLAKMMAPATVVQFGYLGGDSARAFLEGMPKESAMYSFDIHPRQPLDDPRHVLHIKNMTEVETVDFRARSIDILFFDASHLFEDNVEAWKRVETYMSVGSLVILHDTGWWNTELMPPEWPTLMADAGYVTEEEKNGLIAHCPGEQRFSAYLIGRQWRALLLNPTHVLRHGLTVLQK